MLRLARAIASGTVKNMQKREILGQIDFGQDVAEEELDALSTYFVETDQWKRVAAGDVDIVYGAKGSGKSAFYSLLVKRRDLFERQGIRLITAERPRGTPAFKDLAESEDLTEEEFRRLWKLYFLSLIINELRESAPPALDRLRGDVLPLLEEADLIPREFTLSSAIRSALDYIRSWLRKPSSIETTLHLDATTLQPKGITGKITFEEPSTQERKLGFTSVDRLLEKTDAALKLSSIQIWILLDRLDIAFADSTHLETIALRGLFRAYADLSKLDCVSLKLFLRTDIWQSITAGGFREASHITRDLTIEWNPQSLMDLVIRRILHNNVLLEYYQVDREATLSGVSKQNDLFYRIFPDQVDGGRNPKTFDWMLSRTSDGTGQNAPRELIRLLNETRVAQLRRLETGSPDPGNGLLFDRSSLRDALPVVSRVRFQQTLLAEYPQLRERLLKLRGRKSEQTLDTLADIWEVDTDEARICAQKLVDVGFFAPPTKVRGTDQSYRIPFLYHAALDIVRGKEQG